MFTVACDVDGTLFDYDGKVRPEIIALLRAFRDAGAVVVIWSGGGRDYAAQKAREAGLTEPGFLVKAKTQSEPVPDLAIDDQAVKLGKVNFQTMPRLKESA
jgi:phosphoglycolate phosphatase-like HAD superfamily hydrolase